jgi:hypothetical protein
MLADIIIILLLLVVGAVSFIGAACSAYVALRLRQVEREREEREKGRTP